MRERMAGVIKHANGLIAVEQASVNGWDISYNPDDEMFYVHRQDENQTVVKKYNILRNARQYARTHKPNVVLVTLRFTNVPLEVAEQLKELAKHYSM